MKSKPTGNTPQAQAVADLARAAYLLRSGVVEVDCCGSWIAPTPLAKFFHARRCSG